MVNRHFIHLITSDITPWNTKSNDLSVYQVGLPCLNANSTRQPADNQRSTRFGFGFRKEAGATEPTEPIPKRVYFQSSNPDLVDAHIHFASS